MRVVAVTGTDTGVGKTVVTAALARGYVDAGSRVAVVKPAQTGVRPGDAGDLDVIRRLGGVGEVQEHVRLPDPLAPDTAARLTGTAVPSVDEHAERIASLTADVVLVEGSGGLLVRLDLAGGTLADLVLALRLRGLAVDVVVVVRAGLGTLNHSALTVEALRARGVEPAGLVVGSWPAEPTLAQRCNLDDLPDVTGLPIIAVLPAGAGALEAAAFHDAVPGWFTRLP